MEPADPAQLQHKLGQQDAIPESQQQQQRLAVMQCVQTMTHQMLTLSTVVQAAQPPPTSWTSPASAPTDQGSAPPPPASSPETHEPHLPSPERYDGSPGECRSYLTQWQLVFSLQPRMFPTDAARVAYIITQLTGKAKKWGTAAWSADLICTRSSHRLMQEMHRIFDRSPTGHDAGRELLRLRQGCNCF